MDHSNHGGSKKKRRKPVVQQLSATFDISQEHARTTSEDLSPQGLSKERLPLTVGTRTPP